MNVQNCKIIFLHTKYLSENFGDMIEYSNKRLSNSFESKIIFNSFHKKRTEKVIGKYS